jgi:hypothetical protein
MNNSEMNLYAQLVKIAGQHAPIPETAEEVAPETPEEAVVAEAAPVVKIASVTDMSIEQMLENPDFLRGVMDSLTRRNVDIEQAIQDAILPA